MMMRRKAALAAAGLGLIAALPALADQRVRGLYLSLNGGVVVMPEQEYERTGAATQSVQFEEGLVLSGALGYGFGAGWRLEGEFGYRSNSPDNVDIPATPATATAAAVPARSLGAGGSFDAWHAIANVLFDVPRPVGTWFNPYFGGGVGVVSLNPDDLGPIHSSQVDESATRLALQAIAGNALPLTDNIDLTLEYRFFVAPSADFDTTAGLEVDTDYTTHNALLGLRIRFNQDQPPPAEPTTPAALPAPPLPPPPPPPAAVPQVPGMYLVFFEFDRSDLTEEGRAIVATAAVNAQRAEVTRLSVAGHADRSGGDRYNEALSQRRAETVRAELVARGIPDGAIAVVALGESQPLVPTGDGVREPQNRRVEIILDR